jgi:hypothetical protein
MNLLGVTLTDNAFLCKVEQDGDRNEGSARCYSASVLVTSDVLRLFSEHFKAKPCTLCGSGLDYNVLKLRILRLLSKTGPTDSNSLAITIAESKEITLDIHALRMALMRYHKQGLLKRERAGGTFTYALTERGIQRLRWLEQQTTKPSSKP